MAEIILHIGSPKTATTTLQTIFFKNLHKERKINYLGKLQNEIYYTFFYQKNIPKEMQYYRKLLNSLLNESIPNIISNEIFFQDNIFHYIIPQAQFVKRLKYLFQDHNVKIMAVIRKQEKYFYSIYVEEYFEYWYYAKYSSTIKGYYDTIISKGDITYPITTLRNYRNNFGDVNCFIYEELLADSFSFYQKLAKLLQVTITKKDIPQKKTNIKDKNEKGYIAHQRYLDLSIIIRKKQIPIIYYRYYFYLLSQKIIEYSIKLTMFLFKKKVNNKMINKYYLFRPKQKLIPFFDKQQQRRIYELSLPINEKLVSEGFYKKKELKKYGYL